LTKSTKKFGRWRKNSAAFFFLGAVLQAYLPQVSTEKKVYQFTSGSVVEPVHFCPGPSLAPAPACQKFQLRLKL
jgi:hypothetical protein